MDIKPTLDTLQQMAVSKIGTGLELKLNQIIEAKVIDSQLILNALTLKMADQTFSVQAQQPLNLQPGQSLQIQVVKLLPTPEFKILPRPSGLPTADNLSPLLKLISPPSAQPSIVPQTSLSLDNLVKGQQIAVRVVEIINHKITLQLLPVTSGNDATASPPAAADKTLLTVDLKQLSLPPLPAPGQQMAALSSSEILLLQVIKGGKTPVFAVSFAPADSAGKIADALKQLLPIQDSPLPLLNQLVQTLPQLGRDTSVAETLRQLAREILRDLPRQSQLSDPPRLKQVFDDSGLFLERKLLELLTGKTEIDLKSDFKLKLLQLVQLLEREPAAMQDDSLPADTKLLAEILQKTQGALAKLTLDQLNALPKEDAPKQGWAVELPFFHNGKADRVHIEIERDQSGNPEQQQKNWAVSIVITPPNLGTIRCKISCYDSTVNTRFTSDSTATVELINTHLDYLKQQFEDKGLSAGFMDAQQGLAAPANSPQTPLTHLLSEKA